MSEANPAETIVERSRTSRLQAGQSLTSTGQVNAGSIARPSASSRLRRLVWRPRPRAVVAPSAAQTDGELNGRLSQRRRPKQLAGLAGGTACSSARVGEPHLREKMRIGAWCTASRAPLVHKPVSADLIRM